LVLLLNKFVTIHGHTNVKSNKSHFSGPSEKEFLELKIYRTDYYRSIVAYCRYVYSEVGEVPFLAISVYFIST